MRFDDMNDLVDETVPEKIQNMVEKFYASVQEATHHALLIAVAATMKAAGVTEIQLNDNDLANMDSDWLIHDGETGKWTLTIPEEDA